MPAAKCNLAPMKETEPRRRLFGFSFGGKTRPSLNWPREEIQQVLLEDIAGLQVEFAGQVWIDELIPLLREMREMASEVQPDAERLADLKGRVHDVLRKHRLKGFEPYLWMIDCLGDRK
jgi:hypothetical protein